MTATRDGATPVFITGGHSLPMEVTPTSGLTPLHKEDDVRDVDHCLRAVSQHADKQAPYLIGEKLRMFADAARHDAAFAREVPRFLAAVWRVFNEYELGGYVAMQKPAVRRQLRTLLYFS